MKPGPIAVYGAYGHTGRFIVDELLRRGWTPILSGRDATKLAAQVARHRHLEGRVAGIDDPASLDRAVHGAVAVINAAGPFLETGEPVLEAALRAGAHYFDTSAEQCAAWSVYERFDERAREAGTVAMPSVAFYGALAELLVMAAMDDWREADGIDIAVGLDSWHPTQGTRVTGERNHWPRWIVRDGSLQVVPSPPLTRAWRFPPPLGEQEVTMLPLSEIVAIARHVRCPRVHSYMNSAPLRDLRDPATPTPQAVDERGRSAQTFIVDVHVQRGAVTRRATVQGRDIYAVSAPLIVEAMERVVTGSVSARGARSAGQLFDARAFLASLAPEPFVLEVGA
ncbi:saccharopine dehydrogenase NADP-binding domain-containing protein [Lysobacter sp. LF1]|uniref:Saccharopine dehydrogenase NADP-binding domain-containing protein n=1 Tax=Lysobacter stagni TaxID=3045172 RepID=A0ABT6XIC2_9GAMM|nr:saccharopine dehydrogenase NADP-binding domain-containing protein [Lysobacter sp. LF1]MDI9239824.1 saccharopine dehydrogenase NADP-binding domain-containing protein [Lysobacter sp. LF1]